MTIPQRSIILGDQNMTTMSVGLRDFKFEWIYSEIILWIFMNLWIFISRCPQIIPQSKFIITNDFICIYYLL